MESSWENITVENVVRVNNKTIVLSAINIFDLISIILWNELN